MPGRPWQSVFATTPRPRREEAFRVSSNQDQKIARRKHRITAWLQPCTRADQWSPMFPASNIPYDVATCLRGLVAGGIGVIHSLVQYTGLRGASLETPPPVSRLGSSLRAGVRAVRDREARFFNQRCAPETPPATLAQADSSPTPPPRRGRGGDGGHSSTMGSFDVRDRASSGTIQRLVGRH